MISLKKVKIGLLMLSIIAVLSACTSNDDKDTQASNGNNATMSISGSTSVGPLAEKLAHKY